MNDRSQRQYDRFVRVRNFAQTNAADAAATDAATHTTKLDDVVKGLDTAKAGQTGRSAYPQQVLVEALHRDLKDINRTADAIAQETLGFNEAFPMPKQRNRSAILTGADTFIANLLVGPGDDPATQAVKTDRQAKFVAHGFAADFVTQLVAHRGQITADDTAEDNLDSAASMNTAAIKRLVEAGTIECNFLNAIFSNLYRANPDKLAAWKIANHLEHDPKKKPADNPTPTPPQ